MEGTYDGLLQYINQMLDDCGDFKLVARKEEVAGEESQFNAGDLAVTEIISDESDEEICAIRSLLPVEGVPALDLKAFYEILRLQLEKNPDYSLRVSEYFEIDGGFTARVDMPLTGIEADEEEMIVRLLF